MKNVALLARLLIGLSILGWLGAAHAQAAPDPQALQQQLQEYLFDAARAGRVEVLQEFIRAGYDLNTRTEKGYTALILAAYHGHAPAVDLLLQGGADPCAEDVRGNTALMGAIFKGELAIARKLMQAECAPNHRNKAGQTPAMYAALFQRTELLQALRERGADLDAEDAAGNRVDALLQGDIRVGQPEHRAGAGPSGKQ